MTILNKWAVVSKGDPYQAPELCTDHLTGEVASHPRFKDGKEITTSRIIGQRNGNVVTRSGTEYALGEVHPNYEKQFPNARHRLLTSLPAV